MNNIPIKDGFTFLKGNKKMHPTTGVSLEYIVKDSAVAFTIFNNTMDKVLLVKQYRPGHDGDVYEIVAGLIDEGETPEEAAFRELREEAGLDISDLEEIHIMEDPLYEAPAYSTQLIHFFGAKLNSNDIKHREQILDEGEDITLVWEDIDNVIEHITDMKTILGILYFKQLIK